MSYFKRIFKDILNESMGLYNVANLISISKEELSRKDYTYQDDLKNILDQLETELDDEGYELYAKSKVKFDGNSGLITVETRKYFDKKMPEMEMRRVIEKEIPRDLKIKSFRPGLE